MDNAERSRVLLETDRLIPRIQQASDVPYLVDLWADPEVTRYLGGPRDRDWLRSVFEEMSNHRVHLKTEQIIMRKENYLALMAGIKEDVVTTFRRSARRARAASAYRAHSTACPRSWSTSTCAATQPCARPGRSTAIGSTASEADRDRERRGDG